MFVPIFNLSIICYFFLLLIQSISSAIPCVYDLGNGQTLDIRPLGNPKTKIPKYNNIPNSTPTPHIFSWNGCFDFSKSDGGSCTDAAACYTDRQTGVSILVAKQSDAIFEHHADVNLLVYQHGNMLLTVFLTCRDTDVDTINTQQEDAQTFNIYLQSRCACPGKCQFSNDSSITGGGVFLILLFALLFVYIIGGMIFLKVSRGATGFDMIPNRLLWLNIPSYIMDGLRYTIQVLRHRSFSVEYQKI